MEPLKSEDLEGIIKALKEDKLILKARLSGNNTRYVEIVDPREEHEHQREIYGAGDDCFFQGSLIAASKSFLNNCKRENPWYGYCGLNNENYIPSSAGDLWLVSGGKIWAYTKGETTTIHPLGYNSRPLRFNIVLKNGDFADAINLFEKTLTNREDIFERLRNSFPELQRKDLINPLDHMEKLREANHSLIVR